MTFKVLKARQRKERKSYGAYLDTRIHRALSWLDKSEQCDDDPDSQVIFLWIAFNAAYANDVDLKYRPTEHEMFYLFIKRLCDLDGKGRMEDLVWREFSGSMRVLLDNKYVFQPFWDHQNDKLARKEWEKRFAQANTAARKALGDRDTAKALTIALSRIYTLRNQIIHGGATWKSKVNRSQVRDCAKLLGHLVPIVIEIMMDSPDVLWGKPCYPVV